MNLNPKQTDVLYKIRLVSALLGINPNWAAAIAMTESSLGINQLSPTGCKGVFQMSPIAMKDLLNHMQNQDDELTDIVCGIAFLRLLLKRWKDIDTATSHFCDPNVIEQYRIKVHQYMSLFENQTI